MMGINTRITLAAADQVDEMIEVFLSAFKDEATTAAWIDLSSDNLKHPYGKLVKIKIMLYLDAGNPIFVASENNTIVGLTILKLHHVKTSKIMAAKLVIPKLPRLMVLAPHFIRGMRMGMADATRAPENLPQKHDVLEAIAVHPEHQGKKIGRKLLDHAHDYLNNNGSPGIYLMTGEEKNRQIYERFGYALVEERDTKSFKSYHMYLTMTNQ